MQRTFALFVRLSEKRFIFRVVSAVDVVEPQGLNSPRSNNRTYINTVTIFV